VNRRWATIAIASVFVLPGCGDSDDSGSSVTSTTTSTTEITTAGTGPARSPACKAVDHARVERVVQAAGGPDRHLERSANDSLDLAMCEYRETGGPDLYIRITIDTASKSALRYYNLIAEARQRATFEAIPDSTRPVGVRGVGNDRTHGGVGAY
jgi:hypothetical protein